MARIVARAPAHATRPSCKQMFPSPRPATSACKAESAGNPASALFADAGGATDPVASPAEEHPMKTTTIRNLAIAGTLAGAAFAASAATPHLFRAGPPTADELGLSGTAATEWSELREETIDLRDAARATALDEFDKLRALLATDAPDLDAYDREIEQAIDRHLAAARALRQRKVEFYDGLAPDQQAKLRAAVRDRMDRIARFRSALLDIDPAF